MAKDRVDRFAPYAERFFDNDYARENLRVAASALNDAYRRVSKKGARAPADRRFRDRVTEATVAMREAADALQKGRRRPKGQRTKRVLIGLALAVGATGVALAAWPELRRQLFGADAGQVPEPVRRTSQFAGTRTRAPSDGRRSGAAVVTDECSSAVAR